MFLCQRRNMWKVQRISSTLMECMVLLHSRVYNPPACIPHVWTSEVHMSFIVAQITLCFCLEKQHFSATQAVHLSTQFILVTDLNHIHASIPAEHILICHQNTFHTFSLYSIQHTQPLDVTEVCTLFLGRVLLPAWSCCQTKTCRMKAVRFAFVSFQADSNNSLYMEFSQSTL